MDASSPFKRTPLNALHRELGARPGGYPGAEVILRQLDEGAARRRVGIRAQGRVPVRAGAELLDGEGKRVGRVTSGDFGPTVGGPVAMGYVEAACARPQTRLEALVRAKPYPVEVVRLPFVRQRYYRG